MKRRYDIMGTKLVMRKRLRNGDSMKAYRLYGVGDLRLEEAPCPLPKPGEVLVRVKAAGICGSDIPRIYQTGTYHFPTIPGHEFAGVVEEAGEHADSEWKGKRVGVFPLIPCGTCGPCKAGQYEMCRAYGYLGSRQDGGFAEYVAAPVKNLIVLPDEVSYEEAAMLEPMSVAVHAMRKAAPAAGERIAVCGLGTIGLFLLMFLWEAGHRNIYVIGNKDFQKRMAEKLGLPADSFCDSRVQDAEAWLADRTDNRGADVFFECVGRNETVTQAVRMTAPGGRVMLVGNPASDMNFPKETYWKILRNQLTIFGTWNSSFTNSEDDDWHYVLERLKDRRIAPAEFITHRLPFEELEKGLAVMHEKKEEYGKVMAGS